MYLLGFPSEHGVHHCLFSFSFLLLSLKELNIPGHTSHMKVMVAISLSEVITILGREWGIELNHRMGIGYSYSRLA